VAQIRRAVGPLLQDDGAGLALDASVECDIDPLLDESSAGGTEVDVGRFLTELQLSGAPAFEEWASVFREKLRARAAGRLAAAVAQLLARRDSSGALAAAEQWCALVPLDDAPVISVAHVLEQSGRPAEALARLEAHAQRVQQEVGRAAGAALTTLVNRLRKLTLRETDWATRGKRDAIPQERPGKFANDALEAGRIVARLLNEAPLQERESEWQALADAWQSAQGGTGAIVLVEGEHGVGTSRLLRDLGRWVSATGGTVIRASGQPADRTVPFAMLARVVHSAIDADGAGGTDGRWLAELARLDPEVHNRFPGAPPAPASSAADGWRILEALTQLSTVLTSDGPVLVLLDDVSWCDDETAGLLQALIERTRNLPMLWCAAASVGVAGRDSAGARLARTFAGPLRAHVVCPQRLGRSGVRGIIGALGQCPKGARAATRAASFAERVLAESDGIPLFTIALLCELHARGALTVIDGTWDAKLDATEPFPVSAAGVDAIRLPLEARIEQLAQDEREVLMTIALANRACDVELLSLVNGISRLRAAVLCNSLRGSGLLAEDGGAFRCTSRLVGDVVRAGTNSIMRAEAERAIATVLGARSGPDRLNIATSRLSSELSL
jgi:hypothetical protein